MEAPESGTAGNNPPLDRSPDPLILVVARRENVREARGCLDIDGCHDNLARVGGFGGLGSGVGVYAVRSSPEGPSEEYAPKATKAVRSS